MQTKIEKLPKATIKIEVTVPAEKVQEERKKTLNDLAKTTEIKGFRKGNAPVDLVEKSLNPTEINTKVIQSLVEKYYVEALKENKISPISNPKIEITAFGEHQDFVFVATVAVRPDVKLGDYRKSIKTKADQKKQDAKKQKETALKEGKSLENIHDHLHTHEIIDEIANSAELEIPEILIEEEVDRYMARLVDQMQSLDMKMEQYLRAQNKTAEQVRGEFTEMAERNLRAEFALAEAIKAEKIEVTDAEIEETAKASGDPQALENIKDPSTKYYVKSILEKNKLLTSIMEELGDLVADHSEENENKEKKESLEKKPTKESKKDKKEENK